MPEKEKATSGQLVAGGAVSSNGSEAHSQNTTKKPVPILSNEAQSFLDVLWWQPTGQQWWVYIWTPDTGRYYADKKTGERKQAKEAIWQPAGRALRIPASWAERNVYMGVFASTVQREPWQRALSSNIAAISCFFAEFDVKDFGSKEAILEHLSSLALYPSVIVDSGGGYHCYWLLAQPVVLTDENRTYMRRLQHAWVDLVGSDPDAKDLARVLRLPGSYNYKPKYGPDYPEVHFVECHLDRRVPLEQIEQLAGHLVGQQAESSEYERNTGTLDDMAAAIDALQRLGKHHADTYGSWIKVGQALKAGLGDAGLSLWREWSMRSGKYKEGDCEAKWGTFSPDSINLGTLIWMADQDQPREKKQRKGAGGESKSGGQAAQPQPEPEPDPEVAERAERALLAEGAHDEGNAQCVHLRYRGRFCHNEAFGWMQHTGSYWTSEGADAAVERSITETIEARKDAALKSGEADKYGELIKRCIPSSGRVQGAKAQLKSLVYVSDRRFDTQPDLLNCANGVVDLRTGKLSPHSPDQRFTHCTSVPYEPDADQSAWLKWLADTVGGDQVDWLQMAVGYSLTGHTREEVLFYLYGPPRAGKGIFSETLLSMLGTPLADVISFSTLTATREADTQNFNLAPLHSARVIMASESNQYERFNEAKVKSLTGGDKIQAAFKHHTPFSYRPKYKIWLASNQPVNADPDDDACWGRLRVIEFPHSHLGQEDKALKQSMLSPEVLKGVLAWAVAGAQKWYALGPKGLPETAASSRLKSAQRAEIDAVALWLEECCSQSMPDSFTAGHELYSSYKFWCESNGQTPKLMKGFSQALKRKGLQDARQYVESKLKRGFVGVALIL